MTQLANLYLLKHNERLIAEITEAIKQLSFYPVENHFILTKKTHSVRETPK